VLLLVAALLTFQPLDSGLPQTGMWRHGFAVADMNGDARPDLVFTSPRKQAGPPRIFLNQGNGRFERWQEVRFPVLLFDYGGVAAADFNGDGATDLAVGSHYIGVIVLYGDGKGQFTAAPVGFVYPSTFSSRALTVIDWNADGRLDVAALSDGPRPLYSAQLGVTVFENLGSAWKRTTADNRDTIHGDAIAAGDVDGDGLADLATASYNTGDHRVLRLGSDGGLARREAGTVLTPSIVNAVDMADFDGDGRDEVVIGYSAGTPRIAAIDLVSFPEGARPPVQLWAEEGEGIVALATGDLNADGAMDVVAALQDGRLLTFSGNGHGSLQASGEIHPSVWRSGCSASAVRLANLDGSGGDEIIATFAAESGCASGGGIEIFRALASSPNRRRSARH
jgi:hypothetical protein